MWTGHEIVVTGFAPGLGDLFIHIVGLVAGELKSWKNGVWEVYNVANIASYAIDVVEYGTGGSGIYTLEFPAAIDEGRYLAAVCQGTKAAGQFTVPASMQIEWTGSVESSTFEMLNADVEWNIVTDPNQAKKILKQAGTETILLTKNLEQPDGSPVTNTGHLVGKEVKP
jgi:hypothetical protein